MANPGRLFISKRNGKPDKVQFYTANFEKIFTEMQAIAKPNPEQIITHKFETENMGTVMLYSNGECVVHGNKRQRDLFRTAFVERQLHLQCRRD